MNQFIKSSLIIRNSDDSCSLNNHLNSFQETTNDNIAINPNNINSESKSDQCVSYLDNFLSSLQETSNDNITENLNNSNSESESNLCAHNNVAESTNCSDIESENHLYSYLNNYLNSLQKTSNHNVATNPKNSNSESESESDPCVFLF